MRLNRAENLWKPKTCWSWQVARSGRVRGIGDWQRIVQDLFARSDGASFPVYRSAVDGTIFAVIGGVRDARAGKPAYFWAWLSTPEHWKELVKEGWKAVGKIFILAIILDVIYQLKVRSTVCPGLVMGNLPFFHSRRIFPMHFPCSY